LKGKAGDLVPEATKRWEKLIALRKAKGLTQVELAHALGLSRSAYSMYEIGQREPDFEVAQRLAGTLGVTVDDLLDGTNPPSIVSTLGADDQDWLQVIQLCRKLNLTPAQVIKTLQNLSRITKALQGEDK
jgi:DNA-binding XRE family transcriptional regulator